MNPAFFGDANVMEPMSLGNPSGVAGVWPPREAIGRRDVKSMISLYKQTFADATGKGPTGSVELRLKIDDQLPAGAMLYVTYKQTAAGRTGLKLGSGFAGMKSVGGLTTAKGTGQWVVGFIYNGTSFIPMGRDNLNLGYAAHKLGTR